jgi:hypothetical protein
MNKADQALRAPTVGTAYQVRGGSWNNNRNNARCAYRNRNTPNNRNNHVGFRCANAHWRSTKMPQWPATATAVSVGAAMPGGAFSFRNGATPLCQKGAHTLFPVGQTGNQITLAMVASSKWTTIEHRSHYQLKARRSAPLLSFPYSGITVNKEPRIIAGGIPHDRSLPRL